MLPVSYTPSIPNLDTLTLTGMTNNTSYPFSIHTAGSSINFLDFHYVTQTPADGAYLYLRSNLYATTVGRYLYHDGNTLTLANRWI